MKSKEVWKITVIINSIVNPVIQPVIRNAADDEEHLLVVRFVRRIDFPFLFCLIKLFVQFLVVQSRFFSSFLSNIYDS